MAKQSFRARLQAILKRMSPEQIRAVLEHLRKGTKR